jgi:hypothetical protein
MNMKTVRSRIEDYGFHTTRDRHDENAVICTRNAFDGGHHGTAFRLAIRIDGWRFITYGLSIWRVPANVDPVDVAVEWLSIDEHLVELPPTIIEKSSLESIPWEWKL